MWAKELTVNRAVKIDRKTENAFCATRDMLNMPFFDLD